MTTKRWLILALVISVLVNAGLLGAWIGRATADGFQPMQVNPLLGTGRILHDLDPERQNTLKPILRQHLRDLRPNLRELRRAQSDIRSAILAEPFAGPDLRTALDHFQRLLGDSQAAGHSSFVTLVAALTPDERARLVERMRRPPGGGRPPHHDGPHRGPEPSERDSP